MMQPEIIQKLNWVDIFILILMVRALYIGFKRGFISELLHLLALIVSIFVVFHYTPVSVKLLERTIFSKPQFARAMTFVALWGLVSLASKFARGALLLLFKIEAKTFLDKIGGVVIAGVRGLLLCSLTLWLLISTENVYAIRTINGAYTSKYVIQLAPNVYKGIFDTVVEKYFPSERLSQDFFIAKQKSSQANQGQK